MTRELAASGRMSIHHGTQKSAIAISEHNGGGLFNIEVGNMQPWPSSFTSMPTSEGLNLALTILERSGYRKHPATRVLRWFASRADKKASTTK